MKWLALIALLLCCFVVGCVALTSEQQETLDRVQARIESLYAESEQTAAQIHRIYQKQAEVRERLKNGEIDSNEAASLLLTLGDEAKEAVIHYNNLQVGLSGLIEDYKTLKEQGVPWYQTVGYILWSLVTAYLGKRGLSLKSGINLLVKSIENGKDKADIKKRVLAGSNPEVEKTVLKLPA